jgi:hypothetical protein
MTDARQEDQDRIVGQPIKANRVGVCAAAPVCKDKILVGQDIVEVGGNWVHESCVDEMESLLAAPDQTPDSQRPVVLLCGSRTWRDEDAIRSWLAEHRPVLVVHGGHWDGADAIAAKVCGALGIHHAPVRAYWKRDGRAAGPMRNSVMARLAPALDEAVAFWDGTSTGTAGMIKLAREAGVAVEVVRS